MKFYRPLNYLEQERFAYISGDTASADLFDNLTEYEPKDERSIDECLDEVGLYGVRGDRLYDAMCNIKSDKEDLIQQVKRLDSKVFELEDEIKEYKQMIGALKEVGNFKAVKEILYSGFY